MRIDTPMKLFVIFLVLLQTTDAFQSTCCSPAIKSYVEKSPLSTQLSAKANDKDSDFMRYAKQSRSASVGDNVVELNRPLGLVLNEDENGNVYVETVAPKGNAARTGKVSNGMRCLFGSTLRCSKGLMNFFDMIQIREGDIVTMCSATFGDQMWSTRGVGLTRVLAAIRVRSGATVSIVVESPKAMARKQSDTVKQIQAREAAAMTAQAKKDNLLSELEQDELKLKKGKGFFGLF